MQTLNDIVSGIRTKPDKGRLFEALCLYFLTHDTFWQSRFSDAWLWHTWPGNNAKPDTGIDIVAKLTDSDSLCAVQCKFRESDSSITKAEIDSFLATSSKSHFSERILFTLTPNFGPHAQDALTGQNPPVRVLTLADLQASSIDWSAFPEHSTYSPKSLFPHQSEAVNAVINGFNNHNRGKLIMACGTGKTFTSLKVAEHLAGIGGFVLVLVPSISLLNQSLLAWNYDHDENIPMKSYAVCSDSTVGNKLYPDEDLKFSDLAIPPTTDAKNLMRDFSQDTQAMTVIFSTYQSLEVIHEAQASGLPEFDLVICDEAHRTAGTTQESYFRRIHDDSFIHSQRRLYMTATPKIFTENLKAKAKDENILLCSMDDEEIYGPTFHRLSFSDAVNGGLLTDYKVMIFMIAKGHKEDPDSDTMLQGVIKALAKDISPADYDFIESDAAPMTKAVAYSSTIKNSQAFAKAVNSTRVELSNILSSQALHIDGSTPAAKRSYSLLWLKDSNSPNECRILTNARCLCEGVDVPALDAVIFLNPKSSEIDIVQSVGRVMRKAEGKKFGYVILPVVVTPDETPEYALDHNPSYQTVWKVLQALRAHDDHFNVEINSLDLNGRPGKKLRVVIGSGDDKDYSGFSEDLADKYKQEIYVRMVRKCGDREYWESWVKDLVTAFSEISARINKAISRRSVKSAFDSFTSELQAAINPSISREQAVEMLAQHITSKEVFDAIFTGFADNNPVSKSMQNIRAQLEADGADLDPQGLEKFNEHVRDKAASAQTGEAKQKLLREIYENFFTQAFPDTAKSLGIVYTPEEIVDFIIRSADWAVRDLLGVPEGLAAKGVHILDPFSGTGTFTARLIESGLIPAGELYRKYSEEIHANEILLLAYYISAVNIEAAYTQSAGGFYKEFPGMVFADTFRLNELGPARQFTLLHINGERTANQEGTEIDVIMGNPPYSVGRKSGIYEPLDERITSTYARQSTATNKNSLYDSYIRAIRWASDRIGSKGIICYVSNGSYIDSNSADGMRKCLAEEFTQIYIFNLRGNAMTSGELRRKERGNVFGEGTRCPIAVTLFVKDGTEGPCEIRYYEVGDYLTRGDKLKDLTERESFGAMVRSELISEVVHNAFGDWVNQRSGIFESFLSLGNRGETEQPAIFNGRYSSGVKTNRDAWVYNFSREALRRNIETLKPEALTEDSVRVSLYRPYVKEYLHFSHATNERVYQMPAIFPKPDTKNLVICVSGVGAKKGFSVLMTDCIPEVQLIMNCQCFPLFWYEEVKSSLFGALSERRDGISDSMLETFRQRYNDGAITKEDIFCYVYGVLSSGEYASRFGNDTKRVLARVPFVDVREKFWLFSEAGRELGGLHVKYEEAEPYAGVREEWVPGVGHDYTITKMRIEERRGERVIRYNGRLTLSGIPSEAWEYEVNGRSALGWIVERYRDEVDAKSGLRNDCNAWGREHDNPAYVVELIRRVVKVSMETVRILESLPEIGV